MNNISSNRANELDEKLIMLFNKFESKGVIKNIIEQKLRYSYEL